MSFLVVVPKLFKRSCWGTITFWQMLLGLQNFFNSSKILSALVLDIKHDYSLRLIPKIMTVQPGKQIIVINKLPNISRIKAVGQ